jgi:hypothetical protein
MHRQFAASAGSLYGVKTTHPIVCCLCCSRATRLHSSDRPRSAHPPRDLVDTVPKRDVERCRDVSYLAGWPVLMRFICCDEQYGNVAFFVQSVCRHLQPIPATIMKLISIEASGGEDAFFADFRHNTTPSAQ